jgi:hypothetical protein
VDVIGLLDRTMIPDFPIPDSRFLVPEFRIPYGICKIWNTAP